MKRCPTCQSCYDDDDIACTEHGHEPLVKDRSGSRVIAEKYRLERLIGRGGMGEVYLATQIRLGRYTALKLLQMDFMLEGARRSSPELRNNEPAVERYRRHILLRF